MLFERKLVFKVVKERVCSN